RQRFVDRFAPAARDLGLTFPDGNDQYFPDETTGHWHYPEPNWDEFYRVIRGQGPCNERRVALRRFSYERGSWVRRAVLGLPDSSAAWVECLTAPLSHFQIRLGRPPPLRTTHPLLS